MKAGAWALVGLTVAGVAVQTVLLLAAGVPLLSRDALDETFPIIPLAVLVGAVVGALIVDRHPRHRIGWLLCIGQAGAAVGLAAQTLDTAARRGLPVAPSVLDVAVWVGPFLGASYALTLLAALLLLAPDGRLGTRPRRAVLVLLAGSYGLRAVALLLNPPANGPPAAGSAAAVLGPAADLGTTVGLVAAAAALIVRLRRARGEERQQLRWIVVAATALAVTLAVMVGVGVARGAVAPWYFQAAFYLGYLAVPVATGFAVLRYRLYDVDLVIGSAVRLAALAAFVIVGYVAVVVALGRALGGTGAGVWPSLAAYVVVALAFQPLRRRVDTVADRIVHGSRAAPYESLAAFTRSLGSEPHLLERIARACADVAGARWASATVSVPGAPDLTGWWARPGERRAPADDPGRARRRAAGPHRAGLSTGTVTNPGRAPPARGVRHPRRSRLPQPRPDGGPAGPRHGTGPRHRRAGRVPSPAPGRRRRRAVADRRGDPRRCGRAPRAPADGDRGALARGGSGRRHVWRKWRMRRAGRSTALRVITGGVLPPLLARRGLGAALEAYARQSPDRPTLVVDGLDGRRFSTEVEVAVYSCCVDAVRGMLPGAELAVDDRRRPARRHRPGATGQASGVAARRGPHRGTRRRLSVDTSAGGTVLQAVVPLAERGEGAGRRTPLVV